MAILAAAYLVLAPVVHAEQKDLSSPVFFAIMFGAYEPESKTLDSGVALVLVEGLMINPFFGFQAELGGFSTTVDHDVTAMIESIAVSLKLALPLAFVEPYVLGGAGVNYKGFVGFPVQAACGVNFNLEKMQLGAEVRKIWLQDDDTDFGGLMIMGKLGFRY